MSIGTWLLWGVVVGNVVLGGCIMKSPQPEVRYYALALTVPEVPASTAQT